MYSTVTNLNLLKAILQPSKSIIDFALSQRGLCALENVSLVLLLQSKIMLSKQIFTTDN